MTVQNIYQAVRFCFDEEEQDITGFDNASANDNTLMNNIIKAKLVDALRWISLYAPAEQLTGTVSVGSPNIDIVQEDTNLIASNNVLTPTKTLIRVIRVRGTGWHRSILGDSLVKEDSDEYLQVSDSYGAAATADRPQAALMNTKTKKVEVYPAEANDRFVLTYIRALTSTDIGTITDDTDISIPSLLEASFIYYLAFLTLSAYEDSRAARMLEIAKMNLGLTDDRQRE